MITQGSLVRNQPDPPSHMSSIDESRIDRSRIGRCKEVGEWQSNACQVPVVLRGIEATHPTSFWFWGCSSAGRAAALQAVGSGFESCHLHQSFKSESKLKISKQDIETTRHRDNNLSHIDERFRKRRSQCSTSKLLWQKAIWMLVRIT